ncbi:MAG: NYN domain-containing protein [Candidatus Hodarchaeales archaeon]|jgi:uncharacterized LabA/DUF88 family protein
MFKADNKKIEEIAKQKEKVIQQLESLLVGRVNVYIDYANVRPWSERLGWHIDLKRLKRFLDSFDNVNTVKFYYGILKGDHDSEKRIEEVKRLGYQTRTKFVKIMNISIDASSIDPQSPALLKSFIRNALLKKYDIETIEYLNSKFKEMNKKGTYSIKDQKCNFDVEIGSDMLIDKEKNDIDCFVLWSGDSDFHDPVTDLLDSGKKVVLFATSRVVSSELNELKSKGLFIFDIKKIKDFICWKRELGS